MPRAYLHKPHASFSTRLEHPLVVRISHEAYASQLTITEGPYVWRSFLGKTDGNYFLVKTDHFSGQPESVQEHFHRQSGHLQRRDEWRSAGRRTPSGCHRQTIRSRHCARGGQCGTRNGIFPHRYERDARPANLSFSARRLAAACSRDARPRAVRCTRSESRAPGRFPVPRGSALCS
jgi:hypothetical protein